MSGLLPTGTDATAEQEGELRALWLDSDDAGELLSSLSSDTARAVLTALHEEPATASEIAERVDTSLQNVRHHLSNLEEAGLIRVADVRYSEKGREMNVYAPAEEPMVVFVGREDESASFVERLRRMVPVAAGLVLLSLLVQYLIVPTATPGSLPGIARSPEGVGTLLPTPTYVPPGLVFLLGGALVIGLVVAVQWYRDRSTPAP